MKNSKIDFFINYEKTALQIFFTLQGCSLVVSGETDKIHTKYGSVYCKTHFSSSFPGPLIVHGLPVSCPFNFPNGNLKQQLSHIGVFICYQNTNAKK